MFLVLSLWNVLFYRSKKLLQGRDDDTTAEKLKTTAFSSSLMFDSSQESIDDNDSDGDDLVPFDFHMYTSKRPAILTPEKLPATLHLSPVISPLVNISQKEKKYENQIDIKKYLAHNSRIEKKTGCPPQQIHHELEDTISNGGIGHFIRSIRENCEGNFKNNYDGGACQTVMCGRIQSIWDQISLVHTVPS